MLHLTKTEQRVELFTGDYSWSVKELLSEAWLVKIAIITQSGMFFVFERTKTVCGGEITCMECLARAD